MRKLVFVIVMLLTGSFAEAQVGLPKLPVSKNGISTAVNNFITPPEIGDVTKATDGVVAKLMSGLMLGTDKKPALTDAIGGFLKQKQGILGLAKTDPTQYLSKFNPLQKGLFGKLKGVMGAAAFTKFLGMKPAGGDASNILGNLFF